MGLRGPAGAQRNYRGKSGFNPSRRIQLQGDRMSHPAIDYSRYQTLAITRRGVNDAVIDIQMKAQNGKLPTAGHAGHWELSEIWRDIDKDDTVRCAVLRGDGLGFSGGGDLALVQDMASDFGVRARVWKEARDLVYNVINCDKPIVSAMHGPAVGAGLVAGLLADISIASKTAKIVDGHTRLGVAAGTTRPSSGRCCAAWPRPSTT
jgi:enoyl-CoA hydratase